MKRLVSIVVLFSLALAGCSPAQGGGNQGFFNHYFVQPFVSAIKIVAEAFGENYGIAIIVITLAVRFVLMPLMLKTYKNGQDMRVKMAAVKPEMNDIQSRMKEAKTQEEKQKLQSEMMEIYKTHNINPMNMGCLPIVIQMPIFMGVYYAIRSSEEIATHSFLWFNLGETDMTMAIIAGVMYFIQYRVSLIGIPEEQQKQMKLIGLLSPIMILIISFSTPSALPLYWAVGGLFLIIQTLISKRLYNQAI
ncbi:membrane protein insertase YidC [Halobacillus sp. BBL2006]|uniref:membrane protein insertase YidC n=1 Tax=Halobacillus sp. BBL2006 TaxID=1543706 RepID=UPI000541F7FF|nr:membrane protein insertase YidC [Halobacillus sp. BBL2006]KHE67124.1 OxaA-like protein precursor [Halobacillus sp. BBL2006]